MKALAIKAADHPVQPEPAEPRDTGAHDFKHALDKAKPAKKPAEAAPPAAPAPALQPDPTSLAQILAALLNSAAKTAAPAPPDARADVPTTNLAATTATATAQAAAAATVQLAAAAPDKLVQQLVAVTPEPAPEPPLTPLEQAVHDLLSELADKKAPTGDATAATTIQLAPTQLLAPESTPDVQPTAPLAPAPPPAELVSQNHAHLVFDDPNGRVVMTVAVRGSEVNVSVRATDDSTAAALARNAASLDDAMRGRGLQLAQFDAQRDLAREQHAEKPKYERETVKKSNAERFTLEENL
ncbi:MAG TPA: flagellar hook-length control protein FliK [Kofleriaceae bacterium]|nr:flagellar hook-length control protein FliK [Kofleriaceae bacterium]